MNKILSKALLALPLLCSAMASQAQVSQYDFVSSQGAYASLSGATRVIQPGADQDRTTLLPIGFSFRFDRQLYTTFSVSANGFITLGGTLAGDGSANSLSGATLPVIAPLWDDLKVGAQPAHGVSYSVQGTSPARILAVEWKGMLWDRTAAESPLASATVSFKVLLHEATGEIEFQYRDELGLTGGSAGASIGIAAPMHDNSITSYLSLTSTLLPDVSSTSENTAHAVKPGSGRILRFTPSPDLPAAVLAANNLLIAGEVDQPFLKINIPVLTDDPLPLQSLTFSTTGTQPGDITGYRVYFTGASEVFTTDNPISAPGVTPLVFEAATTPVTPTSLQKGNNFLWLAFSISPSAQVDNRVLAQLVNYTVGNNSLRVPPMSQKISIGIGSAVELACADECSNWVRNTVYDENGTVISDAKTYADRLGRNTQVQKRMLSHGAVNNLLVSQTVYDSYGRPALQTLPAPITQSGFRYRDRFITNFFGSNYSSADFEGASTNDAGDVNPNSPLGMYYSPANKVEPYVPASEVPYTRTEYFPDPMGMGKRMAMAGEAHKMGQGHERRMFYMSSSGELSYVFGNYRSYILDGDVNATQSVEGDVLDLFKTIQVNEDGTESVTYTNQAGQVVASCVSGEPSSCIPQKVSRPLFYYGQRSAEVHLPASKKSGLYLIIPQKARTYAVDAAHIVLSITDLNTSAMLSRNVDYDLTPTTEGNLRIAFKNGYQNGSSFLRISYAYTDQYLGNFAGPNPRFSGPNIPDLLLQHELDYSHWSINFYDRRGRLVKAIPPEGVNCTFDPHSSLSSTLTVDTYHRNLNISFDPDPDDPAKPLRMRIPYTLSTAASKTLKIKVLPVISDKSSPDSYNGVSQDPATIGVGEDFDTPPLLAPDEAPPSADREIIDYKHPLFDFDNDPLVHKLLFYRADVQITGVTPANVKEVLLTKTLLFEIHKYGGTFYSVDPVYTEGVGIVLRSSVLSRYSSIEVKVNDIKVDNDEWDPSNPEHYYLRAFNVTFTGKTYASVNNSTALASTYTYNDLSWLTEKKTPDAGLTKYVYDIEGKLRFSQNTKQAPTGRYSYTNYDRRGRPVEMGEIDPFGQPGISFPAFGSPDMTAIVDQPDGLPGALKIDITRMEYDAPAPDFPSSIPLLAAYRQEYVQGKVSRSSNDNNISWYGYDELNRMVWMVQHTAGLGIKTINYAYTRNGELLTQVYQKESPAEALYHHFSYDADRRLVAVETSPDGQLKTMTGRYRYYLHGPLKRREVGLVAAGLGLQGMDYVYTINGWLKSINSPSLTTQRDPGADGASVGANNGFGADMFGMTLDYFTGDYRKDGTFVQTYTPATGNSLHEEHYNGLVKAMRWQTALPAAANSTPGTLMYAYNYDFRNWLTEARFGTAADGMSPPLGPFDIVTLVNATLLSLQGGIVSPPVAFAEKDEYSLGNLSYDRNGNLLTLRRNGPAGNIQMDNFAYHYNRTAANGNLLHNQLEYVEDGVNNTVTAPTLGDIKPQSGGNYQYNDIGQLVRDLQRDEKMEYDVYGRLVRVLRDDVPATVKVSYGYNERGQRISKTEHDPFGGPVRTSWYLPDAGGNVLSVYSSSIQQPNLFVQEELTLYGASRLGILLNTSMGTPVPDAIPIPQQIASIIGITQVLLPGQSINVANYRYIYELTDHLGNVRATVSRNAAQLPELVSAKDYYPHGDVMPGRQYTTAQSYRYDYQGIEKDGETGNNAFQLRQYDGRIGRWYDTDPYEQHASPYLAMGNAPTMRIDPNGGVDAPYEDYESIKQRALETRTYLEAQRLATYLSKGGYYDGFSSGPSSQNPLYAMNNPANFTFYNPGDGYRPEVTMNGVRGYMAQGISQHRSFYSSNPNLQYAEDSYFNVERFVPVKKNNESPAWVQGVSDITGGIGILSQTGELGTDIYMNIRKSNFYNSSKTFNLGSKALNPADKYPLYASNLLKGTAIKNILQTAKVVGVVGNVVGIGFSINNFIQGKGTVMDGVDIGVNAAGIGATILTGIGVISNPVGWAIGGAMIIYGGVRFYQSITEENK